MSGWHASIGRDDTPPAPSADEIMQRRIASARVCGAWTELDPDDLVQRGEVVVSLSTDQAYKASRGDNFGRDGRVVSDRSPLFYVVDGGAVRVLERLPRSWSELLYERERRLRAVR
jgi:hypothetical protein